MTSVSPRDLRIHWLAYAILGVILLASLSLHFNHLGHLGIKDLDEAYHAIVARSLLIDPLCPTLYATAYFPFDYRNWQTNSVWLHKPPVALWQIAGSFLYFGESNFTLRLPSAILATAAVALTFLIGRALFTAEAGIVAAALQALSPTITRLVHGQVFSDHVDVAMLFWCELAVLALIRAARTGRSSDAALAGIAQAIAWMTKSYPALFVGCLAVGLCVGARWLRDGDDPRRLRFSARKLAVFSIAAAVAAAPWIAWCLTHYPREFAFEQFAVFSHLTGDIEQFAAPWDRLLADYLQRGFLEWYALAIVATVGLAVRAIRTRDSRRAFVAAWALVVLVPHVLATSKTPTATLIGWPAGWLAIGALASDAMRGRRFDVGAMFAAGLLLIVWRQLPLAPAMGYGADYRFAKILVEHWPILASATLIGLAGLAAMRFPDHGVSRRAIVCALAILFAFPVYRHVRLAIRTSDDVPANPVAFPKLGRIVRDKSPPNAVFLVDARTRGEAIVAMWWLDRACYPLRTENFAADVATIRTAGGIPFLLSRTERPEAKLLSVDGEASVFAIAP